VLPRALYRSHGCALNYLETIPPTTMAIWRLSFRKPRFSGTQRSYGIHRLCFGGVPIRSLVILTVVFVPYRV
jgi:hypothetical protein